MFEQQFQMLLEEQMSGASGQRLEMLQRDLTGTKRLLEVVCYPVFGTLNGIVLEHEMVRLSGVRIYGDVFHPQLGTIFEEDNFVTHAELVTRERFSFERARARAIAVFGYRYFPYSRDELEKKPEFCQKNLYELMGRSGNLDGASLLGLSVYEREVLRCGLYRNEPFRVGDVCGWLQIKDDTSRKVIKSLVSNGYIIPVGGSSARCHAFKVSDKAIKLLYRQYLDRDVRKNRVTVALKALLSRDVRKNRVTVALMALLS
ncbi:MAG: hypothetical protein P0Y55_11165 [Candidatus Cohnella colombiensis]|uniref:Uncharacterized protein n=1 Tax=Candidatus Cohnella colombiensis TaxID=3121368 RepID=A0AA95J9E1_9BACL|nr:MAG: hypothetical protein P0Y55_11165 [Cohnella sp.]